MTTMLKQDHYPQPDMSSVRNSLNVFNMAIAGRTFDTIKSLQDRVDGAGRTLNGHTRVLFDQLRGLEVAVANAGLSDVVAQWTIIKANETLSDTLRVPACDRIKGMYLQIVERIMTAAAQSQSRVDRLLDEVSALNLDHYADPLISYDAQKLKQLESKDMSLQAELEQLKADYTALQEAINVLEAGTWWDRVKGVVPSVEEIEVAMAAAVTGKVDTALIKVAFERVVKYVNLFEGIHDFSELIDARTWIDEAKERKAQEIKANKKEIDLLTRRAEKLQSHNELLEARTQWLATLSSVSQGIQQFLRVCRLMSSATDEAIRQAPGQMADFVRFMRPIK